MAKPKNAQRESYHKWSVLGVTVLISAMVAGTMNGFGTFYIPLLERFGEPRSLTATIQALLVGNSLSFGIVSGAIVTRIGVPKSAFIGTLLLSVGFGVSFFATSVPYLCISIGVVAGIGNSLLFISSTAALGYTFSGKQRILAVSIQNVGNNIGGMTFPTMITFLLDEYGMRGTFLIMAAVCFHLLVAVVVYSFEDGIQKQELATKVSERKNPSAKGEKFFTCTAGISEWIHLPYILVVSANCFCSATINSILVIVVDVFVWKGLSIEQGLSAFLVFNLVGMVTRLLPGLLKVFVHNSNSCIPPIFFTLFGALSLVVLMLGNSYEVLMTGIGLLGIPFGGVVVSSSILVVGMVPPEQIALAIGMLKTATGLLVIAVGPIFGSLYDSTDSYELVLTTVGTIQLFCMCLFIAAINARRILRSKAKGIDNLVFVKTFLRQELWV